MLKWVSIGIELTIMMLLIAGIVSYLRNKED